MSRPQDLFIHSTARQRLKEARKSETRALYKERVEPELDHAYLRQKLQFGRGKVEQVAVLNSNRQPVNHNGQLMDAGNTAIARAVHGDFYLKSGGAVGDIYDKTQGKAFRCRAAPPPVDTLKQPIVGRKTVKPENNALYMKPLVDTPRSDAKHQHRHHRRYRHEDGCPHACNPPRPASAEPRRHHRHSENESVERQRERVKRLDMEKVRQAEATDYRTATSSSRKKERDAYIPPPRPSSAEPARRHSSSSKHAYETALGQVKSHRPGEAAMMSGQELERINRLASTPRSTGVASEKRTKRRKDAEQMLF